MHKPTSFLNCVTEGNGRNEGTVPFIQSGVSRIAFWEEGSDWSNFELLRSDWSTYTLLWLVNIYPPLIGRISSPLHSITPPDKLSFYHFIIIYFILFYYILIYFNIYLLNEEEEREKDDWKRTRKNPNGRAGFEPQPSDHVSNALSIEPRRHPRYPTSY